MITIRLQRSDGQWVAKVSKAKDLFAWSPSLTRLRAERLARTISFDPSRSMDRVDRDAEPQNHGTAY